MLKNDENLNVFIWSDSKNSLWRVNPFPIKIVVRNLRKLITLGEEILVGRKFGGHRKKVNIGGNLIWQIFTKSGKFSSRQNFFP